MSELEIISNRLENIENLLLSQKTVLSFSEASIYLELSPSYLYKLTSKREIPHFCPNGKKLSFNREELDKWLQRNPRGTQEELERKATTHVVLSSKNGGKKTIIS